MKRGPLHLGYCTNVHPGEGLDAIDGILSEVAAVKARVSPKEAFGTGLRLGNEAVSALISQPNALAALSDRLRAEDLYVFTANGFPYGDFAAEALKEQVYAPSWLDPRRAEYTRNLAEVIAALPGPSQRTISTVAGGFLPDTDSPEAEADMARALVETAEFLRQLADNTGVSIRLCLEPEPWTTLETTNDAIRFFHQGLFPAGDVVDDHLGLCFDCCHQALFYESPKESLKLLRASGVPIGKVQVSSALHVAHPELPAAKEALFRFDEPRYLHQVTGYSPVGVLSALDLPDLKTPPDDWLLAESWRCHFHVPIWWDGDGQHLQTTRSDWEGVVKQILEYGQCEHFEIETYSWDVIPEDQKTDLAGGNLVNSIALEFSALEMLLEGVGY